MDKKKAIKYFEKLIEARNAWCDYTGVEEMQLAIKALKVYRTERQDNDIAKPTAEETTAVSESGEGGMALGLEKKVYSVDFDGTLCTNAWPEIGQPKPDVIEHCKRLKADGHKLILNTCRENELLNQAITWCYQRGLYFDAHNENLPELIELYGGDCRKISADYYLDDKNLFLEGVNG